VITNHEEGKGKPPQLFPKAGYPLGYPEPALQQKTEEMRACACVHVSEISSAADEFEKSLLTADDDCSYDSVIEINLDTVIGIYSFSSAFIHSFLCFSFTLFQFLCYSLCLNDKGGT